MNDDLRALGAMFIVLALGGLWQYIRHERNRKYSAAEWLEKLREHEIGTAGWTGWNE